jgi:hypothetical protein
MILLPYYVLREYQQRLELMYQGNSIRSVITSLSFINLTFLLVTGQRSFTMYFW